LSLTVSATLREKPLSMTPGRQDLAALLQAAGGIPDSEDKPTTTPVNGSSEANIHKDELHGLQEVNLLDSLSQG
jgi:hypothetical protein